MTIKDVSTNVHHDITKINEFSNQTCAFSILEEVEDFWTDIEEDIARKVSGMIETERRGLPTVYSRIFPFNIDSSGGYGAHDDITDKIEKLKGQLRASNDIHDLSTSQGVEDQFQALCRTMRWKVTLLHWMSAWTIKSLHSFDAHMEKGGWTSVYTELELLLEGDPVDGDSDQQRTRN